MKRGDRPLEGPLAAENLGLRAERCVGLVGLVGLAGVSSSAAAGAAAPGAFLKSGKVSGVVVPKVNPPDSSSESEFSPLGPGEGGRCCGTRTLR